ncbi:MAG: aldo/keto reductase [Roseibium sp.]|nr:aldo/keto reductase [Roseibium sp.]
MGLLTGKYGPETVLPPNDIRSTSNPKTSYFVGARSNPTMFAQLNAVRDLLTTGGRTLAQGAIGWLWATGDMVVPVPGARTVEQIEGLAEALTFGALPECVMGQIEVLIEREPEDTPDRAR